MPLMPRAAPPPCCRSFRTFPAVVRGVLVLTTLEAVCAFGYAAYETRDSR